MTNKELQDQFLLRGQLFFLSLSITASCTYSGVGWSAQRGSMWLFLKVWRRTICPSWSLQTSRLRWEERQSHSSVTGKASLPSTRSHFSRPWRALSPRHCSRPTASANMWVTAHILTLYFYLFNFFFNLKLVKLQFHCKWQHVKNKLLKNRKKQGHFNVTFA